MISNYADRREAVFGQQSIITRILAGVPNQNRMLVILHLYPKAT